jgi:hypothetical protein
MVQFLRKIIMLKREDILSLSQANSGGGGAVQSKTASVNAPRMLSKPIVPMFLEP